jgi:adenylate kinase
MGCPGAGKSTQGLLLSQCYCIAQISTGNLLRDYIENDPVGHEMMKSGALFDDELVTGLLVKRLEAPDCAAGFVIDGYPRNIKQAEIFAALEPNINKVILIGIADELIVGRMARRKFCAKCGITYHDTDDVTHKICDVCGQKLLRREDDEPETVQRRLDIYHQTTKPLADYYENEGLLARINGIGTVGEVQARIIAALAK